MMPSPMRSGLSMTLSSMILWVFCWYFLVSLQPVAGAVSCRHPQKFPARSAQPYSILRAQLKESANTQRNDNAVKPKFASSRLTREGKPQSYQLLTTGEVTSCKGTTNRFNFKASATECAARSMRLCTTKENLKSPGPSCSFWTGTPCGKGASSRMFVQSNGKRKCLAQSTRIATTVSCCMDTVHAPACQMCPPGTFAKPEWTRIPNERGVSLCSAEHKRPNIVMFVSDDMRYFNLSAGDAIASYASPSVTVRQVFPNLAAYAQQGVFFANAHTQISMCSPSRISFMTGLRPDTTKAIDINDPMRKRKNNIITITQALKSQGYRTFAYGKIFDGRSTGGRNVQDFPRSWSERPRGFKGLMWSTNVTESNCGYGDPAFNSRTNNLPFAQCVSESPLGLNASFGKRSSLPDEILTQLALNKLDDLASGELNAPFFLAVGLLRPHLPFTAPYRHYSRFRRDEFPFMHNISATRDDIYSPIAYRNDEPETYTGWTGTKDRLYPTPPVHSHFAHGYYAACSFVDEMVGRVVDKVRSHSSIANDTFFIFLSDHGYHLGDHEFYGKKTVYESGTRVPLLLFGPERFFPLTGRVIHSPVELLDLVPTLYEMTMLPDRAAYQGTSLVSTFRSTDPTDRVKTIALSQFYAFGALRRKVMSYSMRGDRFRFVVHFHKEKKKILSMELYDYLTDPLEKNNVKQHPEHAQVLSTFRSLFALYLKNIQLFKDATTSSEALIL